MDLDRLLGSWKLTMHHSQVPGDVAGTQVFTRVLDGAFIQLDWRYEHPAFPSQAIALINESSFDYFDVRGVRRIFDYELADNGFHLTWIELEFSQRSTWTFRGDDVIEVEGDRSTDGGETWEHDFSILLERESQ